MDVGRAHHGPFTNPLVAGQTTLNSGFAVTNDFTVGSTHLKCPLSLACVFVVIHTLANTGGHFELSPTFLSVVVRLYEG
jgi:hypothetical protein